MKLATKGIIQVDTSITFLTSTEEKEFIRKKAKENGYTMSDFIKMCINEYLEKEIR